ncbi:spore germination protein [Salibacterium aidingense]|uniref:spore germination protein n=1 Tax=Salibacterium aidingense TaxID=384933 RepID=UPI003BD5994D
MGKRRLSKKRRHHYIPEESNNSSPITSSMQENVDTLYHILHQSNDVNVNIFTEQNVSFAVCWITGLVENQNINDFIIAPLREQAYRVEQPISVMSTYLHAPFKTFYTSIEEAMEQLIHGNIIVWIDGVTAAYSIQGLQSKTRPISEPSNQTVIRGPKEAFVESISVNSSLIRRKIKNKDVYFESMYIGKDTQTEVQLCYSKQAVDQNVLEELTHRLQKIKTRKIFDSGMLEELLEDYAQKHKWYSPFPISQSNERPDAAAAAVQEGRIAVLVDGSPFVLLYPCTFFMFFQSAEDYYQRFDFASFVRILRFLAFFISLYLPSIYIAITTYHPALVATDLLINLSAQREGIPFPAFVEAMLMEIIFEILREGGIRMPKTIGPAISIVGAIVLGDSAVRAGLVSPAIVIVVSLTAIASFVAPAYDFSITARLLRFAMMISAALLGLFGIFFISLFLLIHLVSLESMGKPYMAPLAPLHLKNQQDMIIRTPYWLDNIPFIHRWKTRHGKKENLE